jgi:hypothetical protein
LTSQHNPDHVGGDDGQDWKGVTSQMNIQIRQIKGDIVELLFNPREVDLRVGENLTLRENGSNRGLIVQIIEFRTINYPSLLTEMMDLMAEGNPVAETASEPPVSLPESLPDPEGLSEMSNLKLAIAKIRKVITWAKPSPQAQMANTPA